ncbi:MAG: site-2 protease family protein [bacterium]|nr:site-2 protease family protein [bacterium]
MTLTFGIFLYLIIIFSAVFHEFMHGWTANYLGDPTAKYAGRLTLNPLKHIDKWGTVIIPLLLLFGPYLFAGKLGAFIGWAKPVPYNPLLLSDKKYGSAKVGFAGPAANFIIAIMFGILIRFIPVAGPFYIAISWVVYINIFLALFNLIPIPPLDGSKLLMDFFPRSRFMMMQFSMFGTFFALLVAIMVVPPIARLLYYIMAGHSFIGVAF